MSFGGEELQCQTCKKPTNLFGAQIQTRDPNYYDPFGYNPSSTTTIIRCSYCIDKHGKADINKFNAHNGDGPIVSAKKKIARNDPCPCKSGKKWKKCCGATK